MAGDMSYLSATEVVAAIRTGEQSASRLVDAQLSRIAMHNPCLNAIVTLDEDGARRRANELDEGLEQGEAQGVLCGLPVTVKDVFEVAGMRSTCSHPPLADHVPECDAIAVARLRAAGAVILGKTNVPELAMDFQTVSPLFGRANNPWDLNRTPGGSTGGGAAAVAAGLSFLELGSDLAGSLRIPASFCGLYGLAPTARTVPRTGSLPGRPPGAALAGFLRVGLLARSVADLKLGLSVIAGPHPTDPDVAPIHTCTAAPPGLEDLRIAWADVLGIPISGRVRAVLAGFADELAARGCHVERVAPPGFDFAEANRIHQHILMTAVGATLPVASRIAGRYLAGITAFDLSLKRYLDAEARCFGLTASLGDFLSKWDAWVCPVTAMPAFEHLEPARHMGPTPIYGKIDVDGEPVDYVTACAGFTSPLNVTGHPVVVMPVGMSPDGLPIGVQVVGRRWDDWRLLSIAEAMASLISPRRPALDGR